MLHIVKTKFHNFSFVDGATIKILATPVIKYMQLLLEYNRADDIELFGNQVRPSEFIVLLKAKMRFTKVENMLKRKLGK